MFTFKGFFLITRFENFAINFLPKLRAMSNISSSNSIFWVQIKTSEKNAIITMYIIMTLFGGFGNVVSLVCVYKQMKVEITTKQSHKILMALVVSDIITSLCLYPNLAASLAFTFLTEFLWSLYLINMILSASSSLTLILLSLERFLKLTKIQRYDIILTERKINLSILMYWLVPIFLAALGFFCLFLSTQDSLYAIVVIGTLIALSVFYAQIYWLHKEITRACHGYYK